MGPADADGSAGANGVRARPASPNFGRAFGAPPRVSLSACPLPASGAFLRTLIGSLFMWCQGKKAWSGCGFRSVPCPPAPPRTCVRSCPGGDLASSPGRLSHHLESIAPPRALLSKAWQGQKQTLSYNILGRASKMQKRLIRGLPEAAQRGCCSDAELGFGGSWKRGRGPEKW